MSPVARRFEIAVSTPRFREDGTTPEGADAWPLRQKCSRCVPFKARRDHTLKHLCLTRLRQAGVNHGMKNRLVKRSAACSTLSAAGEKAPPCQSVWTPQKPLPDGFVYASAHAPAEKAPLVSQCKPTQCHEHPLDRSESGHPACAFRSSHQPIGPCPHASTGATNQLLARRRIAVAGIFNPRWRHGECRDNQP